MTALTHDAIDSAALMASVQRSHCGGSVLFLGTVRDLTGDEVTEALDYTAYEAMAAKSLAEIETEMRAKWPIGDIAIVHRLGHLPIGAISVAVAVSCPHRKEAFAACQYAIDTLKAVAPIWKQDVAAVPTAE
jgi:molybdopterin synthase catalytic subunit